MATAAVNGIEICYETFGDRSHKPLLLIAGFGQQLIDWHPAFCQQLVDSGFFVVRFDNRDSGLSTHFSQFTSPDIGAGLNGDASSAGYTLEDMADDVVGLLDQVGVLRTQILAVSMGAMVAQLVAIKAPERVSGLVLLSSSTGDSSVGQPERAIAAAPLPRPEGADILESAVESSSRWASFDLGITEETLQARIKARIDRAYDPLASPRQLVAIAAAPDRTNALKAITAPTVVIHGTDDPLVNVSGGEALARAIPDAELVLIDRLRHDMPEVIWPQLINAVKRNAQLS